MGGIGWQDYCVTTGANIMPFQKVPTNVPPTMPLSILGITGLTAYFGMGEVLFLVLRVQLAQWQLKLLNSKAAV